MKRTYYYSKNKRIPLSYLESVKVVRREPGLRHALIGWRSFPISDKFELLLHADIVKERTLPTARLNDLIEEIIQVEEKMADRNFTRELHSFEKPPESLPVYSALLDDTGRILLQTGEVIARFHSSLNEDLIRKKLKELGGEIVKSID